MGLILQSVRPLAQNYDVWFCDIWGVMHNGKTAFDSAVEACRKFRKVGGSKGQGGLVILLTNAPRPAFSVQEQLAGFGVPDDCFDAIVSSGDVAQHLIAGEEGKAIYHLGPARDHSVIEQANITPVTLEQAELILLTGLMDDEVEGPEDYREMFEGLVARDLPMICANPDLQVERGARLVYCAGILAQLYEELGGRVIYAGKPHLPIYDLAYNTARDLLGDQVDKSQVLCIGDGLKTDMPGAFQAGYDALFVASGLHVGEVFDEAQLGVLFAPLNFVPVGALRQLCWT